MLRHVLPAGGDVLEIAAGTGEHAIYFAGLFPGITWQPTDVDPRCLASIAAWAETVRLGNLRPAIALDVSHHPWPGAGCDAGYDAVVCVNLIHFAPWSVCGDLMQGAAGVLKSGGVLMLYGPFMVDGRHTAPSNAAFDADLKALDPRFGVRDLAEVKAEATAQGLSWERTVAMPANNAVVIFRKGHQPERAAAPNAA